MNNSLTGYGHDSWDMYDMYEIYIPNNYALMVELNFPIQNDLELFIRYQGTWGLSTVSSSYNDNPETGAATYSYGGQSLFIIVQTDRGSGEYTLDITMITPANEPGANPDDCGTGVDASDNIYTNPGGNTWLNGSTQIDANGDVDDVGGTCTAWISDQWDERDYYNVLVPPGKYLEWNVTWSSSASVYTYVYKCQVQTQPCSGANPAYYVSQPSSPYSGTSITMTHTSGLWVTNGGWLTLGVYTYSAEDITYTMDFNFLDLSNLVGGVQDDAGSGVDAGPGVSDAVHVNDYNNMTNEIHYSLRDGITEMWIQLTDLLSMYLQTMVMKFNYNTMVSHTMLVDTTHG
tara:strand:- start:244 stop:1278 length:1035 start_codon:yes stop_codon:yes gene_type:complete